MSTELTAAMNAERTRLLGEREESAKQLAHHQERIATIDRTVKAMDTFLATLNGSAPEKKTTAPTGTRRTGIREEILELITKGDGLTRADIITARNAKGDVAEERAISNALSALKKDAKIDQKDGKYIAA